MLCCQMAAWAVPAYRGWQTKEQPDGTTIQLRLVGDEFYHYWENEAGQQVLPDSLGFWQVVGAKPTPAEVAAQRAMSPILRSKMTAAEAGTDGADSLQVANAPARVGAKNLAPRGLFILVNFSDKSFNASNTQAAMNDMMNAANYTYNGAVGSARQYFSDQSNGAYTPTFDVVGPVTLTKTTSYYGSNIDGERGQDAYAGDMIIEACKLADTQFGVDFTKYDNDNDGKVDFVYVIYAGQGEADGGAASTVWPHNWSLAGARYYGNCTYSASQCKVDGKYIDNYACSGELNGSKRRSGIGTLCHEFSHVLGLPDFYDTQYGYNYENDLTPGDWDVMASGNYNSSGNCPPNYSPWEKYFFGWAAPGILNTPANITLTTGYADFYQINSTGRLASATSTDTQYYIENRQKNVWDSGLPGHGMLVWQVKYNSTDWGNNTPNNTDNNPRYTVVSAKGTAAVQNTNYDTYPGSGRKTAYTPFSQYPLTDITENTTAGTISFAFMGGVPEEIVYIDADIEGVTPNVALGTEITKADGYYRTFTAAPGYADLALEQYLVELTIGGADKTDLYVSRSGSVVTVQIPAAALIGNVTLAFYNAVSRTPVNITWNVQGVTTTTTQYEGEPLKLPTAPADCNKMVTFVGWTATPGYKHATDAPADLFVSSPGNVSAEATYYATYALNISSGAEEEHTLSATYGGSNTDWTISGTTGSSYWILKEDASIMTPEFDLSNIQSITLNMRTYGGATYKTVDVYRGDVKLGSASASSNSLADQLVTFTSIPSGTGRLTFRSATTTSANGPGVKSITIVYKTGGMVQTHFSHECFVPVMRVYSDCTVEGL